MACLVMGLWLPNQPTVAVAAPKTSCTSSAVKFGSLQVSSEVGARDVRLCANWTKQTPKTKSGEKSTSSSESSVPKKPIGRPVPAPKLKSNLTVKTKSGSILTFTHQVSASPSSPRIEKSISRAKVGEAVRFTAIARTHSNYRLLLGSPTEIRFRPIHRLWKIGGTTVSSKGSILHRFTESGLYRIRLYVSYEIWYRVWAKSPFRRLAQTITLPAIPAAVLVGAANMSPRFVHYLCSDSPEAWGCSP